MTSGDRLPRDAGVAPTPSARTEIERAHRIATAVMDNAERHVLGQTAAVELAVVCLLAQGHLLIEGPPGLAKTRLARVLARSLGCTEQRIQCTPDLLATDVTGTSVLDQATGKFDFAKGPIFANIVIADEINRATPKTQAAFLEAMEELQVTESGVTHPLVRPFMVVATQNPIDFEGTYPLPEAQLDRFLVRLTVDYPDEDVEVAVASRAHAAFESGEVAPVVSRTELLRAMDAVAMVRVDHALVRHAVKLARATRLGDEIRVGASPRGSIALIRAARALACVRGRDFITVDDVRELAHPVLEHRILLSIEGLLTGTDQGGFLDRVLTRNPAPVSAESGVSE